MTHMKPEFHLIIGLGNPGEIYQNTYHNIGVLFVDILRNHTLTKNQIIHTSNTFMNQSGLFVKQELKKHAIIPKNLLVVHDDSDIQLGTIKISYNRGSAGHKGIENIIHQIKTQAFWRLRIGIRPPEKKHTKAETFVLKNISLSHKKIFEKKFAETIENIFGYSQ